MLDGQSRLTGLAFADNIVLISEGGHHLQDLTSGKVGLRISTGKSNVMHDADQTSMPEIAIGGHELEEVSTWRSLGSAPLSWDQHQE